MKKQNINGQDLYYEESDDPVVNILENNKTLFGESNFNILDKYNLDKEGFVVDCGAHIGTFCFTAAQHGRKILAIEGADKNAQCLKETFKDFDNVIVKHKILLDSIKKCEFTEGGGPFGWAEENSEGDRESDTLDNIIKKQKIEKVSAIKYDIEGNEIKAIDGSLKVLEKHKPVLIIEVNGHCLRLQGLKPFDVFDKLDKIGYKYWLPLNDGKFLSIDKNFKYPFCVSDIICIHKDKIDNYNDLEIIPPLKQDQIYDIFWENYNRANEDCKMYFDSINE